MVNFKEVLKPVCHTYHKIAVLQALYTSHISWFCSTIRSYQDLIPKDLIPKYLIPKYLIPKYLIPKDCISKDLILKERIPKYFGLY